ncbi:Hypoxic response protein 1 [Thalassocella blandensis]|nr:Hypoxic response protein 1 [Thalassocella blandensis]
MKVLDYCNREVVVVHKDKTPLDAAVAMRECHSGDVVVVEEVAGKVLPLGIVTDRDIAVEIVAEQVDPQEITVKDLLFKPLITVHQNEDYHLCVRLMKHKAVRRVPVVDDEGALVGIISVDDIIEQLTEDISDLAMLFNSPPTKTA